MKYNLKIDRIKHHEFVHKSKAILKQNDLPSIIDLRSKCIPVYDQGELGSCTANALCGAFAFDSNNFEGSRLFVYYNERKIENDIPDDNGALLSDGIKSLQKYGVCAETEWPYDISKFTIKPPNICYTDALKHKAVICYNLKNDLSEMKHHLNNNIPFVAGIKIFESFESQVVSKTGNVSMPQKNEKCLGGHAVCIVGYTDEKQCWIVRNSWGSKWGDSGYFYLPYLYLLSSDLSSDLWAIESTMNI